MNSVLRKFLLQCPVLYFSSHSFSKCFSAGCCDNRGFGRQHEGQMCECERLAVAQQNRKHCNQDKCLPLCAPLVLCREAYQSNASSLSGSSCTYVRVLVPVGIREGVAKPHGAGSLTQNSAGGSGTRELPHSPLPEGGTHRRVTQ